MKPYCWVIPKMQQGIFYKEKPPKMHTIPLYTHSVKQLSDEEIDQIWTNCNCSPDDYRCFARAIIKEITE